MSPTTIIDLLEDTPTPTSERSFSFLWREEYTKSPDLPVLSSLCFPRRGHKPHYTISEKIESTSWPRNASLSPRANNGGQVLRHYVAGGSHYRPIRSRAFSSFQILSSGIFFSLGERRGWPEPLNFATVLKSRVITQIYPPRSFFPQLLFEFSFSAVSFHSSLPMFFTRVKYQLQSLVHVKGAVVN